MAAKETHVAIIGGGLCGLALAVALTKRSIRHTLYEARSSFTEIGAGINLGPNTIQAFNAIDPALSDAIFKLAVRNEPDQNIWFNARLGAPTSSFEDGHLITGVAAPPTGNMTTSRNELLQMLAQAVKPENTKFDKKIAKLEQTEDEVTMTFEDGTQEKASIVIGCDGAHSTVRRLMLGAEHPAAIAKFSNTGGYRAIFTMAEQEQIMGYEKAHSSQLWCGPGGYIIQYPIDRGSKVNIGLWPRKGGDWKPHEWVLHNQKQEMLKDFDGWGSTIQKLMNAMSDGTQFWATFHHSVQPESFFDRRVCIIGDAAHAMTPHQGQGAAQAMEDACVMAEVLGRIDSTNTSTPIAQQIEGAFTGFEAVRKERCQAVLETSLDAHEFWAGFLRPDLTQADVEQFADACNNRLRWIWDADVAGQVDRAVAAMQSHLSEKPQQIQVNGIA